MIVLEINILLLLLLLLLKERPIMPGGQTTTNHTSGTYTDGHGIQLPTQVTPACPLQGHDGCHDATTLQQRFTSHTDNRNFIVLIFPTQVTKLIFTSPTDILYTDNQTDGPKMVGQGEKNTG